MKCLNHIWFCAGHGNVGILKVFDDYEGVKFLIGECSGVNKEADIRHIMDWGSTFPYVAGVALFGERQ